MRSKWKKALGTLLITTVTATSVTVISVPQLTYAEAATTAADQLILNSESPITSGATLRSYTWKSTRNKKAISVNAKVIAVDLTNPNVKLDVMTGSGEQFTKKQTIAGMAKEYGAAAGINGDFYNTKADGAPMGPQVSDGVVMSTAPLLAGYYSFAVTKDRKPLIDTFSFSGLVTAADGASFNLNGINKAVYWYGKPSVHAMNDSMFIYTSAWGSTLRAVDRNTDLLEVLVVDGIVQQIQPGAIKAIPPENGYILRTEGKARKFVLEHMKVGDPVSYTYQMIGSEFKPQADASQFNVMIGGGTLLVDKGKPVETLSLPNDADAKSARSRTSVGFSADQKFVYLVTADKTGSSSDGVTLKELGKLLAQIGVWRGINLDGGGSTQLVSRPLGDTTAVIANGLENNWQRPVVNGLGVFSTAPKGQLAGLIVSGAKFVLKGEQATFSLKGYDQYDNPVDAADLANVSWTTTDKKAAMEAGVFTSSSAGKTKVTASLGGVSQNYDVQVIGRDDIQSMSVVTSSSVAITNSSIKLSVKVKTKSGAERTLPGQLFSWELQGIEGQVTDNILKVSSVKDSAAARIVAHYDGYGATATLPIGVVQTIADWDSPATDLATAFASTAGVTGTVANIAVEGNEQNRAIELAYDMTTGTTDTKAAYVSFPKGVALSGQPQKIQMQVRGDQSLNWLRAEMIDADNKLYYIELEPTVNWKGWKTVSADLAGLKMKYPVKLNKLYVASPKVGEDERNPIGSVAFDQISFLYKQAIPGLKQNTAKLTLGKKKIEVNGVAATIDVAPLTVNGRTFVPLRFIVDALGGEVQWDPVDKRITVFRGSQMAEMRVGEKDMIFNGQRVTTEAAPISKNARTLVPLRLLSEQFGWIVDWNDKTKEITLR
ncbi:stalk domain-containing protein [Cohnella faecalis]|uniref:Copper amine oxidase n=1 Tax=Cohnella faecalis TaxID=2315694 RepID=A0A398CE91_9BACL|nr:stalk domain-containing protein [Cohnella faecalis]RIE00950.1 copper amine oxidase [Cohnella faecalis]